MTMHQARIARKIMAKRRVPMWSRIVDAALSDEVAFTNQDTLTTYVDASRFGAAHNSWWNVILHECGHLTGAIMAMDHLPWTIVSPQCKMELLSMTKHEFLFLKFENKIFFLMTKKNV